MARVPARLVGELFPRVALPLPSGPRFPCQQLLSHLSRGEQGLQGLWSPETEGVLDQGWPCKLTLSEECQGNRIPGDWGSWYTRPSLRQAIHV